MFRAMLLIHRNQIVFLNRCCMLGFLGFSGTKCSTGESRLQGMGREAGGIQGWHSAHFICLGISKISLGAYLWNGRPLRHPPRCPEWNTSLGREIRGLEVSWRKQVLLYRKYKKKKKKSISKCLSLQTHFLFSQTEVKWVKVTSCVPGPLAERKVSYRMGEICPFHPASFKLSVEDLRQYHNY